MSKILTPEDMSLPNRREFIMAFNTLLLANWDAGGAEFKQSELVGMIVCILKRTTGESVAVTVDERHQRILWAVGWHIHVEGETWEITPIEQ